MLRLHKNWQPVVGHQLAPTSWANRLGPPPLLTHCAAAGQKRKVVQQQLEVVRGSRHQGRRREGVEWSEGADVYCCCGPVAVTVGGSNKARRTQ